MLDVFGVRMLHASIAREWYSQFHIGPERTFTFGCSKVYDPELIFRGNGTYTIRNGILSVSGACPRIYVRGSDKDHAEVPISTPKWKNVEVTFYSNTINAGSCPVSYAGVEAVVRTDHYPDSDLCNTRGLGGKWNFDGRCQFEKETVHGCGNKQANTVYPFTNGGRMPLNKWIGYKYIVRSCDSDTACHAEMYTDMTNGKNGGSWIKVNDFIDRKGWSSDVPSCCETHRGAVLDGNYSVYLRTDGVKEQLYKWFSVREINEEQAAFVN